MPKKKLGPLIKKGDIDILTGPFGTQLKASDYVHFGTPVINVRNIGLGNIRPEKLEYIDEAKTEKLKKHLLKTNDIVFGRKGAVDRHVLISEKEEGWLQGSDCLRIRIKTAEINPRFLSFFFQTKGHQDWMNALGSFGSTMTSLNQEIISRIEFPAPPLPLQTRIADLLSAYDELIEVNNRRIALLEQTAEQLYKEWFVRLRFPGYAQTKVRKGVPEGWRKEKAKDIFKIQIGKTPPRSQSKWFTKNGEGVTWLSIKDMNESNVFAFNSTEQLTEESISKFKVKTVPKNSILLSFKLSVGEVRIATKMMATNEAIAHFLIPQQKEFLLGYTYFWLKLFPYPSLGNTSSIGFALNSKKVKDMPFLIPSKDILKKFDHLVKPIFDQIKLINTQNQTLRRTRDLLLPRLISGQLSVAEAETALNA